ncbi:hypothetical protein [Amycolatopsis sp. YIM 10]|uniref:hypothetical protein n=1 Tax=Amycolatopsis sp. YIM 10 TaxID=2653857 RepID=UPI0012905C5A|nr:hypothetical protein [Amycolatopsis sp. YIM 10]
MNQGVPSAIPAIIAVAGTLFGAFVAGMFGLIQLRRQLGWQREDAQQRYRLETERWAHSLLEERESALWQERRVLYSRLLLNIDSWIEAIRDLRDTELPKGVQVSNRQDVESRSPVAWSAMKCSMEFKTTLGELRILGHPEIVEQARRLHVKLIRANREALEGDPDMSQIHRSLSWLTDQMRARLTRDGKPLPPASPEPDTPDPVDGS